MKLKKVLAMACALCMATAMFASCGDTASDETTETTTTAAAANEDNAEDGADDADADAGTEEGDADADADAEDGDADGEGDADTAPEGDEPYIDEYTGLEVQKFDPNYVPVTEFEGYDAFLMFADANWLWSNFAGQGYPEADRADGAYGIDADITGDGEYTVAITVDSIAAEEAVLGAYNPQITLDGDYVFPAQGAVVFNVDITGICDGTTTWDGEAVKKNALKDGDDANVNKGIKGKYTGQELEVHVTSIKADGEEIDFDESKIHYGNIEDANNCYRIEIYNDYGDTAKDPGIDKNALMFAKSLEVTFTIEGLDDGGAAADGEEAEAETEDDAAEEEAAE